MKKGGSFGEKNKKADVPLRSSVGTTNSGSGSKKTSTTTGSSGSGKPSVGGVSPGGKSKKWIL